MRNSLRMREAIGHAHCNITIPCMERIGIARLHSGTNETRDTIRLTVLSLLVKTDSRDEMRRQSWTERGLSPPAHTKTITHRVPRRNEKM